MKKIVFLIHPRSIHDLYRRFPALKILGDNANEFILKNLKFPKRAGFSICSKFNVYGEIEGYLIAVLLTAKQMTIDREGAQKRILDAVLYAQDKLKADLIGLGALTKSVTEGGKWLSDNKKVKVALTNGDTLTTVMALEAIEKIINKKALKDPNIAVVGATGVIGRAISMSFLNRYKLILVGRRQDRLKEVFPDLIEANHLKITSNLSDIATADIVITATNHHDSFVKSEHLKENAIIYDLAQPYNVGPDVINKRPDIVRIDGGYVGIPDINLKFNMGAPKGTTFACLTETILQALENDNKNYVGHVNIDEIELLKKRAQKYNFTHAAFTSFEKLIDF